MRQNQIQSDALHYEKDLIAFFREKRLLGLLKPSVDHVAVKTKNSTHYEQIIQNLFPFCTQASYTNLDRRRLATLELSEPIRFDRLGQCRYLEVMEPRPEKVDKDLIGFDHIEIYYADLAVVEHILHQRSVLFLFQENPNHRALVLQINKKSQEIKFTDRRLRDIVAKQLQTGESFRVEN